MMKCDDYSAKDSEYKRKGFPWSKKEDAQLNRLYEEKKLDLLEICEIHERTPGGILSRLAKNYIIATRFSRDNVDYLYKRTDFNIESSADYVLYFEGIVHKHKNSFASAAIIIEKNTNKIIWKGCKYFCDTSSSCYVAEYEALLLGLNAIKKYNLNKYFRKVEILGDSLLVVNQVSKKWICKNHTLIECLHKIEDILENIRYDLRHVPVEQNFLAYKLAKRCIDERKGFLCILKDFTEGLI